MTFHIDRIEFDHGIDDAALRAETVATRWRLIGHIQDGQGKPLSGPGLLEMSPNTLVARMNTMPALARVDASTLEAALAAYEQARSEWNTCLATAPDEVPPPRGPRPA